VPNTLLLELHEGVQTVTLNRPEPLNAMSLAMLAELSEVVKAVERDDQVKSLVFTGAGRAFSAGADITEFRISAQADESKEPPHVGEHLRTRVNPLILRIQGLEKPVLAAVNGVAAGVGMSLALACDVRYAAESARFIQAFVNIGLVPDGGSTYFLPRLVGISRALELAWTGAPVSAQEALELGVVSKVLPDAEVLAATQELAARLARGPARAIALTKRGFNKAHELPLERVLEMEAAYQEITTRLPDFAEGVAAFLEKRPARFTGK
jgi:2-(1,2-epoxy-1,2-dihydrophenyl)acetyl-CoA isomerase